MLIIDTHAHIYSSDDRRYPPIPKPLRPPGGNAAVEDLKKTCDVNGVTHACLVQTSSYYGFDNRYLCDAAKANSTWAAGICTLNPDDPHSPGLLQHYARNYNVKGMRSIPARSGKLDDAGVRALWKAADGLGIVINVLVSRDKTEEVDRLAGLFPKLRVVLDHCLNLKKGGDYDATLADLLRLARRPNLHAKLTFLATGSDQPFPCEAMHAACVKIVEAYGAERCVWGSDFPNALWTPKVSYREYLRLFTEVLPFSASAREGILGKTAERLWFRP
ncbi:MAG: amidohydrolase family protein [Bryobacteraceae bacterium]|nr:amidohydrolase family protein [Bryobacteraceae bacterium]